MMRPGGMQLTVMPCRPTSRDNPLDQAWIAALAGCAAIMRSGSDLPLMLMTRPHLRSIIPGSAAWVSWRRRVKLSVIASCHLSSGASMGSGGLLPPAELTRMSIGPSARAAACESFTAAPSGMMSISTMAGAVPPAATISFPSSSSSGLRRAATHTLTPSAASPLAIARPMPMLAPVTSAVLPFNCRSIWLLSLDPGLPGNPQLAHRRERNALRQHAAAVAPDLLEQGLVDRRHDDAGALRAAVLRGQLLEGGAVIVLRALDLERHQPLEIVGFAPLQDVGLAHAVARQLVEREVDAVAPRVLADVAHDVGQLKGEPEVGGVAQRAPVGVAENLRRQEPDDARDPMAIALERREIGIAVVVEIHLHAVDDLVEARLGQVVAGSDLGEGARDGVLRAAPVSPGYLVAPPRELRAGDRRVGALVHHVVHFAAERIERRDRPPALRRQEQEAVIEARAAGGGFLLAILMRVHFFCQGREWWVV